MYAAPPPRPKKTSIVRSRAGCDVCRKKHRKCDEVKPICGRCRRNDDPCTFPAPQFEFRDASSWAAHKSRVARNRDITPGNDMPEPTPAHASICQDAPAATPASRATDTPQSGLTQYAYPTPSETEHSPLNSNAESCNSQLLSPPIAESSHANEAVVQTRIAPSTFRSSAERVRIPPSIDVSAESKVDGMYMSHFVKHVIRIVPFNLKVVCNNLSNTRAVEFAAMALSAANMANLKGGFSNSRYKSGNLVWAPDGTHLMDALRYTKKALSIAIEKVSPRVNEAIAAHLLILFVEAELGTFKGLRRHLGSISKLALSNRALDIQFDNNLISAVADSNVILRYVAGLWNPTQARNEFRHTWMSLDHWELSTPAAISMIVSNALVCSMRAVIIKTVQLHMKTRPGVPFSMLLERHWQHCFEDENSEGDFVQSKHVVDMNAQYDQSIDEIRALANRLRRYAPPSGLSMADGTRSSPDEVGVESIGPETQPILFSTHEKAMEAAEYAFAHIVCDEILLFNLLDHRPSMGSQNPWLHLLLRIAMGLDPSACVFNNKYRRGIVGMVLQGALRCESAAPLSRLNDMIGQMVAKGGGWEDFSSPLIQTQLVVQAIEQQLRLGRQILMAASREINLNCNIFSSLSASTLMLHGREADGRTFDEEITIDLGAQNWKP